jgi:hypothetical protein
MVLTVTMNIPFMVSDCVESHGVHLEEHIKKGVRMFELGEKIVNGFCAKDDFKRKLHEQMQSEEQPAFTN